MAGYIARRIVITAVMAVLATLVIFLIANVVPGDPILAQLGDDAAANPALVAAYRARWGLDLPLWEQYWIFLRELAHGNLGVSIWSQRPVLDDIRDYAPATVELATAAILIAVLVGVPLGIAAAARRDSWIDHVARFVSLAGVSAPGFWLGFLALALFYGALGIAPGPGRLGPIDFPPPDVTGLFTIDSLLAGDWSTFRASLSHLVMPAIILSATTMGVLTRTTRAAMLEALGQDYVKVARAKGLKEWAVLARHALPNALLPVVTLGGLTYADLLTGAIMIETVFSWPGLGRYAFRAAAGLDIPAIMGLTLLFAIIYLIVNLIVDLSYAILDPRVAKA
jgi:peptide/nickel transport system permease protein